LSGISHEAHPVAEKALNWMSPETSDSVSRSSCVTKTVTSCTVVNPWPGYEIQLQRNGSMAERLTGERISFETEAGEVLTLRKVRKKSDRSLQPEYESWTHP
jgi:hypothetical protein